MMPESTDARIEKGDGEEFLMVIICTFPCMRNGDQSFVFSSFWRL